MRFSNDGAAWSAWDSYATTRLWTLPVDDGAAGDGDKTVYAQYRDHVGHTSVAYSDTIVLDTQVPVSSAASPASSDLASFTVTWSGTDRLSGIDSYDVQYRVGSGGAWITWLSATRDTSAVFGPSAPVAVERGETYYIQVRARDNAGNLGAYPGGNGHTSTYVGEAIKFYLPVVYKGVPQRRVERSR
jgi:hypothetical protein